MFWNYFFEILNMIFMYMFLYNLTLLMFFWNFSQLINISLKTMFSFSNFKFSFFFLMSFIVSIFSLAGVPPFAGFFSKMLILTTLINTNFFFLYILFFVLLFMGLYFYVQNIRFLLSSKNDVMSYQFEKSYSVSTFFFLMVSIIVFFLIFGVLFFDDLFIYFYWLLK